MSPRPVERQDKPTPPSHPLDRRVTIVVSGIAVIGVLLGGLVAAASSYWTARVTSGAQAEQQLVQFRRDEAKTLYVDFMKQATEVQQLSYDLRDIIEGHPPNYLVDPTAGTQIEPLYARLSTAMASVTSMMQEMSLVAPEDTYEKAWEVENDVSHVRAAFWQSIDANGLVNKKQFDVYKGEIDTYGGGIYQDLKLFAIEARKDLA